MYTICWTSVRRNARAAKMPKLKTTIRVQSTCHPDTNDFNEAAMTWKKELEKHLYK